MNCLTDTFPEVLSRHYCLQKILHQKPGRTVFLANHRGSQQQVAIKVWGSSYMSNPSHMRTFTQEVRILATLSHKHVVKLLDYGQTKECTYMVMEYVPGMSLRKYLLSQPISFPRAFMLMEQLIAVVAYLHQLGIIHRDIKPENILITPEQQITVIDFGLATLTSWKASDDMIHLGTPSYMSPEVRQGEPCSCASDQYAVGVVAYELFLGDTSRGKLILSLLPEKISKLLAKALATSPKDRYESMVTWLRALQEYLDSGAFISEMKEKDHTIHQYEMVTQQQTWLMPQKLLCPSFLSVQISRQENGNVPVYYDAFVGSQVGAPLMSVHSQVPKILQTYTVWFWFSQYMINPLLLSTAKGLVNQGHYLGLSISQILNTAHECLMRMESPVPPAGISVLCLQICEEKQHFVCFACGKTSFQLKKQDICVDVFQTDFQGLGVRQPLQIHETKVAWEIGNEAVLATRTCSMFNSFSASSFMVLKDRTQKAIFSPMEGRWLEKQKSEDGSPCLSTCISLKRIR